MPVVGEGGGQTVWAASWEPRGEAKQAREPGGEDTPQGLPEEVVGASGLGLGKGRGGPTPGPARKSELRGLDTEAQGRSLLPEGTPGHSCVHSGGLLPAGSRGAPAHRGAPLGLASALASLPAASQGSGLLVSVTKPRPGWPTVCPPGSTHWASPAPATLTPV